MNICQCCSKLFAPKAGSTGKFCSLNCSSKFNSEQRKNQNYNNYLLHPKLCLHCSNPISFKYKNINSFCSKSCAAIFNNNSKDWSKIKTGPKPGLKIKDKKQKQIKSKNKEITFDIEGPFTKIYLCTCKITGMKWYSKTIKTIHPSAINSKKLYSYQCRFNFSISKYPKWFSKASSLIKLYGWYSAANRGNNLNGCSRDHLYSILDGYKNKVDPKILSHPANCEIKSHKENQKKKSKSSITLDELLVRIKLFEESYGEV
jgi:predicted nucleic acid-binding Zn ribbon protein